MKKDNFDLKAYLVENKMTENSRGEARHHFGEAKLDTRILTESLQEGGEEGQFEIVPVEECGDVPSQPANGIVGEGEARDSSHIEELKDLLADLMFNCNIPTEEDNFNYPNLDEYPLAIAINIKSELNTRFLYASKDDEGADSILLSCFTWRHNNTWKTATDDECEEALLVFDEIDDYVEGYGDDVVVVTLLKIEENSTVDECDAIGVELDEMDQELSEAGYTDDDFSDPDADAAVAAAFRDKGAKKAFDKDVAKDAEVKDFDADMENDPTDPAADFDDEEGDEPVDGNAAPAAGGITVNDLIPGEGKKVEEMRANTEILVDLKDFFDEHPTYKLATLQRFIRNGFRAIKEFGYKEVLLKPQAIGYDINNRRREDAVVRLTRPTSVSQYGNGEE